MTNTQSSTTEAAQLFGYDVQGNDGSKIGSVDGVWVDDATGRAEFIAVKTGWLFGKNHVMPIEQGQIDNQNQTIQVPYSSDQIKNGPSFGTDAEFSAGDEQQIYDYYGMERSTERSPTGYAGGGPSAASSSTTGQDNIEVPVAEEQLKVGKRQVESGQVRLRKVVRTEHEEVPVELTREQVDVERIPAGEMSGSQVPESAFQEQTIEVPLTEEEPVVAKEAQVTGEVRVNKRTRTETQTVGADLRQEEVEVDDEQQRF
jgi:uncharacterized protein (TIGR02271 family)